MQGYFQRADYSEAIKTPIALVPSGSGAACLLHCMQREPRPLIDVP